MDLQSGSKYVLTKWIKEINKIGHFMDLQRESNYVITKKIKQKYDIWSFYGPSKRVKICTYKKDPAKVR